MDTPGGVLERSGRNLLDPTSTGVIPYFTPIFFATVGLSA